MTQRGALQLHEAPLPGGMHDLENELAAVRRGEVEVFVVLAGEAPGAGREAVELASQANGVAFRHRNPALELHDLGL